MVGTIRSSVVNVDLLERDKVDKKDEDGVVNGVHVPSEDVRLSPGVQIHIRLVVDDDYKQSKSGEWNGRIK